MNNGNRAAWRSLAAALVLLASFPAAAADAPDDRRVILVTLDGVRIEEIFGGMDAVIANAPEAESGV